MSSISYRKTVVGWINYTVGSVMVYNINPQSFRKVTGVSGDARQGACEVTAEQLAELKQESKYIGLADGWELVPSDVCELSNVKGA